MGYENHELRNLRSYRFAEVPVAPAMRQFAEAHVLPRLILTGYKLPEQRELATQFTHWLLTTATTNACVADPRNKVAKGAALRAKVWDAIVAAGLAHVCLGTEESGRVTRYAATGRLVALAGKHNLTITETQAMVHGTATTEPSPFDLITVHSGRYNPVTGELLPAEEQRKPISLREICEADAECDEHGVPNPKAIANGLADLRAREDLIEQINRVNSSHSWQAFYTCPETGRKRAYQPNINLKQIHAGQYGRAARLYTTGPLGAQSIPKAARREMLIDGEQVAELDFSGMATRMLYHWFAHQDPQGDVYRPNMVFPVVHATPNLSKAKAAILRDFVKRCTNICWNTSTPATANSAAGMALAEHPEAAYLRQVLKTERMDATHVIPRIQAAHPALAGYFFKDVGPLLMTQDGKIMLHILLELAEADIPALGIHDAVLCRASDAATVEEVMVAKYRPFFRKFPAPVVKRMF